MVSSKCYNVINNIKDSGDDPLWIWAYVIRMFASEGEKEDLGIGRMRESIISF